MICEALGMRLHCRAHLFFMLTQSPYELCGTCQRNPAVGQSLSIRTDLLSPAYIRGLETLQDQVPPFETSVAKQILEAEWGRPVEAILESLPARPIAAASLGQVYKAKLKSTGQEVAIKVLVRQQCLFYM